MPEDKVYLSDALEARDLAGIAIAIEREALSRWKYAGVHDSVFRMLQVAATYRLVVAQEQTAYLMQRLVDGVDADERDK